MTSTAFNATMRFVRVAWSRALAASLITLPVTLAGAADSHQAPLEARIVLVEGVARSEESITIDGRVRIAVRFRTAKGGTFTLGGATSDVGSFTAVGRVAGGRLQLTETLAGSLGTIRIRATRTCAGGAGTWRVLSGTGAYQGLSGGGVATGGPRCATTRHPAIGVYTGTVRTPPPLPVAQAGRFGGATSQREEVVFDVAPGGRTLAGLKLQRLTVRCSPTMTLLQTILLPGPYEIEDGGSFAAQSVLPSGMTQSVTGRFTSGSVAVGMASISHLVTDPPGSNTKYTCSGSIHWTASQPPPSALPGRYCGFTHQGPGICIEVAPTGREITRFESGVIARCFPGGVAPSEIQITLTFSGTIPLGGHLGFSAGGIRVDGLVSGTASIRGLFEPTATVSGSVGLGLSTLDYEGTRYNCHPASGRWEARR